MARNKVVYGNETLIDLTADTVDAAHLAQGYTAHDRSGAQITGTMSGGGVDIPQFEVVWYDDWSAVKEVTCNMTYAECQAFSNAGNGDLRASVFERDESMTDVAYWSATLVSTQEQDYLLYTVGMAVYDIRYNPNGTIQYIQQSSQRGAEGTPVATKGAVSNHSVSVTPSVTNTAGYITGSTKTGTAVTVSASELVSGSETKIANGTYDVTNLAELVVNVSSGGGSSMNVQVAQSTSRANSSTYTRLVSLTCEVAGTYDVYWSCYRSSTSGTSGSQLHVGSSAYGTANTTFTNHIQNNHLTGVTLSKNQTVAVYARSRGSNYYAYCGQLTIVQTA